MILSHLSKSRRTRNARRPLRVFNIILCVLPAAITALFYALRENTAAMEWAAARVSAPVRGFLGSIFSGIPFSLMEILCALLIVWLIVFIVRTLVLLIRGSERLKTFLRRILALAVAALYIWGIYSWLWNVCYFTDGFAEKHGFATDGVTAADLISVTGFFAAKVNELAPAMRRDTNGRYTPDPHGFFDVSTVIYDEVYTLYPDLAGKLYKPKPMMFSWLMSRTGYTGIYFALTGESNINMQPPAFLMPSTIAHELAHQRGVAAEDEANFVGVLACVTSGIPEYEYAGFMSGLIYLQNALFEADYEAYEDIRLSLCPEVNSDFRDWNDFWQSQKTVDTGSQFIDGILTSVTETVSETVDSVYDGFLKSNNQTLGLKSYGACVDLLVQYYSGD